MSIVAELATLNSALSTEEAQHQLQECQAEVSVLVQSQLTVLKNLCVAWCRLHVCTRRLADALVVSG